MQSHDEVDFLVLSHLHLIVLDTFELLRLFLDWEVLILSDYTLGKVNNLVCVRGRVQGVLGRNIDLSQRLLELGEAFMIRRLLKKLISLIIDNHLKLAKVQFRLALD